MPRPRPKKKSADDYIYVVVEKNRTQVSLRSPRDSVRAILLLDGIKPADVEEHLRAIDQGGSYAPLKGPIKEIHRVRDRMVDLLYDASTMIKHTGTYGVCWWHKLKKVVWWIKAAKDNDPAKLFRREVSSDDEIRRIFYGVHGVSSVRIETEAQPDPKRDRIWMEIYPG